MYNNRTSLYMHSRLLLKELVSKSIFLQGKKSMHLFKKDAIVSWHQKLNDKTASWISLFIGPMFGLYEQHIL